MSKHRIGLFRRGLCSPNSTLSGIKCDLCDIDCYLDCALARKNLHNLDDSALSLGDSAQCEVGEKTYLGNTFPIGML